MLHYPCICAALRDEFSSYEASQMLVRACDGARQLRMKFALFRSQLLKAERLKVATGCQACLLSPKQTRLHVTANASQTGVVGEVSWRACSKYRRPNSSSSVSCAFKCAATRSLSWLWEAYSTRFAVDHKTWARMAEALGRCRSLPQQFSRQAASTPLGGMARTRVQVAHSRPATYPILLQICLVTV